VTDPGPCSRCMRHLAARVKLVDGRPAPVLEACKRCREAATPQGRERERLLEECHRGGWWSS
jgi:hypothetical protein